MVGESKELIQNIENLHEQNLHHQIIGLIRATKGFAEDYQLVCLLARAYNNLDKYEEAIVLLESVEDEGKTDALWHFRLGYAYYYRNDSDKIDKALELTKKAYAMGREDALELIALIKSDLDMDLSQEEAAILDELSEENLEENGPLVIYSEKAMNAVEAHVETYFGEYEQVFHEIHSPDLHIDLLIIAPRPENDFYTIITLGAGAYQMEVPEGYDGPDRMELFINLPKDWNIQGKKEEDYWPLRWLKILARLPLEQETWLGWGHSVPAGQPLSENTQLNSVLLTHPTSFGEDAMMVNLSGGERVAFWQVVPLYEEELQYKLRNGTEALEEVFDGFPTVVDITRSCAVGEEYGLDEMEKEKRAKGFGTSED